MLEILILIRLAGSIGKTVTARGHKKFGYQLLLWVLWFGGEFLGAIFGSILGMALADGEEPGLLFTYLCALGGAVLGAVIAFTIARRLPDLKSEDAFYVGDGYDRRWRDEGRQAPAADGPAGEGAYTERPAPQPLPDERIRE